MEGAVKPPEGFSAVSTYSKEMLPSHSMSAGKEDEIVIEIGLRADIPGGAVSYVP